MEKFYKTLLRYLTRGGVVAKDMKYEDFILTATFLSVSAKVTMNYSCDLFGASEREIQEHANYLAGLLNPK